jgi:hypothetical protein
MGSTSARHTDPGRRCKCGRYIPYQGAEFCSPRCWAISLRHTAEPCRWCGCCEPYISGDEVHPGYSGPPCCPDCKGT